jgi:enoyl-CoA hydratase/carnithine racemase
LSQLTEVGFHREGEVAHLILRRPDHLNALSPTLISQALAVVKEVGGSDARALVLSGEGRAFSAGVDTKIGLSDAFTPEVSKRFSEEARELVVQLETIPQVTIAKVHGYCFTGGLEVALGCDLMYASEDAQFCDTHAKIGLRPGWGLSQRLPLRIGVMRAREMSYTGRRVGAREALGIGLVTDVVPADQLDARVDEAVKQIAGNKWYAVAAYKTLYRASQNHGLDEGLGYEATFQAPRLQRRKQGA